MKTINDFRPLFPAEQKLLDACKNGEIAKISDKRPTEKTVDNEIRAEFLRTLILYEKDNIDPKGIQFQGAYVSGVFDFESCETNLLFYFCDSCFEQKIILCGASIKLLNLNGSKVTEIDSNRCRCEGSVFLGQGFIAIRRINFINAWIGADFNCIEGVFNCDSSNDTKYIIQCDRAKINGSVLLKDISSDTPVSFQSSKINANVNCEGATFISKHKNNSNLIVFEKASIAGSVFLRNNFTAHGKVNFSSAQIGSALSCRGAKIDGDFDLSSTKVKDLMDIESLCDYAGLKNIHLDGLIYEHICNEWKAEEWKKWLEKMQSFKPQPYRQLAKVLRDMGHIDDANEVMIQYQDKILEQKHERLKKSLKNFSLRKLKSSLYELKNATFSFLSKKIYRATSRYGYKPIRTFTILIVVWLSCSMLYWHAANAGVFAPSNPIVFQNKDYNCSPTEVSIKDIIYKEENGSKNWYYSSLKGEYTTFQPFLYSLDVILPVVDLYVEKDWGVFIPTPSGYFDWLNPTTITFNHIVRLVVWLEIIFGWALSLILIAVLSGLAKTDKD